MPDDSGMNSTTERTILQSEPEPIGEELALDNVPSSYDLYIKDDDRDTGVEPNKTAKNFWTSPSIWVRNEKDDKEEHENPYVTDEHDYAYIYVRIHNRGKTDYQRKGMYLHTYYANASTVIRRHTWIGMEGDVEGYPTGAANRVKLIDVDIPAGGSQVLCVKWDMSEIHTGSGSHHYCIYAKLLDTIKDESYDNQEVYFAPWDHKGQAQKNVTLIKRTELDQPVSVYVRNGCDEMKNYTLKLVARTSNDRKIFTKANVELVMSPKISLAWERGGSKGSDICPMSNSPVTNYKRVKLETAENKLENINMYGSEFDYVSLKFNFIEPTMSFTEKYTVDIVQYDDNGNMLGGETFIVEPPIKTNTIIEIKPIPGDGGQVTLKANSADFKSVNWKNSRGEIIGSGGNIVVNPSMGNDTYEAVGYTEDGGMAVASVSLEGEYGIRSLSPSASVGDILNVELCGSAGANAQFMVSSIVDGSVKFTEGVAADSNEGTLNVAGLPAGLYSVSYMVNGTVKDSRKFTKK